MTAQTRLQAQSPAQRLKPGRPLTLAGIADGAEGLVIADLARAIAAGAAPPAISAAVICRDGPRLAMLSRALGFFAPDIEVLEFPAWDCLPYDRVSPHGAIVAQRMTALARLASVKGRERPAVLLTTVNAILQRVPARAIVGKQSLSAAPGNVLPMGGITHWLELNGFNRASTVREPGDYAVRGGILDLFAPGMGDPVRLDFFGDTLESIRSFDPESQRTHADLRALNLVPMAEFQLTSDTIRLFRTGYVAAFGAAAPDDVLYEAVSEGRRHAGMEHWLPLFHQRLETLFDYLGNEAPLSSPSPQRGEAQAASGRRSLSEERRREASAMVRGLGPIGDSPGDSEPPHPNPLPSGERERAATPILLEPLAEEAAHERLAQILDYYQARKDALDQTGAGAPYKPLPPDRLYLAEAEWRERLENVALARLTPFAAPEAADTIEIAARAGHNFSAERSEPNKNVFEAVTRHVHALQSGRQAGDDRAVERRLARAHGACAGRARLGQSHPRRIVAAGARFAAPRGRARRARHRIRFRDRRCRADQRAGYFGRAAGPRAPAIKTLGKFHRRGDESGRRRSGRPRRPRHRPLPWPARHRGRRRAARLSRNPLCRRRQAVPAGREHRAVVALRLRRSRRRARPARQRRLASAQIADEEPHPRDRERA